MSDDNDPVDVLIVDDDEAYADLTRERMALAGLRAEVQLGPFGAVNTIRRLRPRVVLLDVNMPAIRGEQVLDLLHARALEDSPRVIFLSSMDGRSLAKLAKQHGAHGWLSKSATRVQIVSAVRQAIDAS
ncbi:MAG: response regulator [Sandaracinaceae bacterium]